MTTNCPFCDNEYKIIAQHVAQSHSDSQYQSMLVSELHRLNCEYGEPPTQDMMNDRGRFSARLYELKFNSWNAALQEAGLTPHVFRDIDKNVLIDELRRLDEEYRKSPTTEIMNTHGEFSSSTYIREFGSWNNALEEAGISTNKDLNIDRDVLIDELKRLDDEYDKDVTKKLMTSEGKFGYGPYYSNFGSWNNALEEAGISTNKDMNIDRDVLIDELQRISDDLGKCITEYDMTKYGNYGTTTYRRRFGSWNEALIEAGLEPVKRGMAGMEQSLYILDCGGGKYYVGVSSHLDARLCEHKRQGRQAANWVQEHGVEERIYLSDPMPHEEAYEKERKKTLELMEEHGWENVRGSQWLSVELGSPPKPLSTQND